MAGMSLDQLGNVLIEAGWTVESEVRTLVRLARSGDPLVAMRAMAAINGIVREIIDPEVQRQLRIRLESVRRTDANTV